ncbi:hypothetical protein GGR55DRAFT_649609 [Xylaria sp. FL0064]|nr:hypothetical protein GGR55DRAFT_649609 [Xylaria sp. FL0064]
MMARREAAAVLHQKEGLFEGCACGDLGYILLVSPSRQCSRLLFGQGLTRRFEPSLRLPANLSRIWVVKWLKPTLIIGNCISLPSFDLSAPRCRGTCIVSSFLFRLVERSISLLRVTFLSVSSPGSALAVTTCPPIISEFRFCAAGLAIPQSKSPFNVDDPQTRLESPTTNLSTVLLGCLPACLPRPRCFRFGRLNRLASESNICAFATSSFPTLTGLGLVNLHLYDGRRVRQETLRAVRTETGTSHMRSYQFPGWRPAGVMLIDNN